MTQPLDIAWGDRVLLVAPHPDDETLAAGGLLQRARSVHAAARVVFVTDGENNPWAQRATERRWRIGPDDRERWGVRRRGEALAALRCLGLEERQVEFLGFPDQGITRLLLAGDDDLAEALAREIERFRPTVLVAPALQDLHPDHSALAVLLRVALERLDSRLPRPREHLFIVHHRGPVPGIARSSLRLTPREVEGKRRAILCHRSQLTLRRSGLLAFADAEEHFFPPRVAAENSADHPLTRIFVEDDAVHFDFERRARPGAFGEADLVLALEARGDGWRTLRARLPRRSGPIELFDSVEGSLHALGEYHRSRRGERVSLPATVLRGWPDVFAKLERRFGFFDEAGWRAVPAWTQLAEGAEDAAETGPDMAYGRPPLRLVTAGRRRARI
jgi:LmbE family N-acetylglucosaminyl deacetylase